jgi:hypothetical protein
MLLTNLSLFQFMQFMRMSGYHLLPKKVLDAVGVLLDHVANKH